MTEETTRETGADDRPMPPFVILEHLAIGGFETVRVAGVTRDEMEAHNIATAMSNVGLRVWLVDLWGDEAEPTISRYVGEPGAAYLHGRGMSSVDSGAGNELTENGL